MERVDGWGQRLVLATGASVLMLCISTLSLPAASGKGGEVEILAPRDGQLASNGSVTVRIRSNVSGLRVLAGGRKVTSRFGTAVNGVRTARLIHGRDYQGGMIPIYAAVGRRHAPASDSVIFHAARSDERLLRFKTPRAKSGRQLVLAGRTSRRIHSLTAMLNGRQVEFDFDPDGPRKIKIPLGADDGLRHGFNRLIVEGHRLHGLHDSEEFSFKVPGSVSIAGAEGNLEGRPHRAVTLDGSASVPADPSHQLHYRWDVLETPPGANATITNTYGAQARFHADQPGTYVAKLTVGSTPPASAPSGRSASTAVQPQVEATSSRKRGGCPRPRKGKRKKKGKACPRPTPQPQSSAQGSQASLPPASPCNGADPLAPGPDCKLPPSDALNPASQPLDPASQPLSPASQPINPLATPLHPLARADTLTPPILDVVTIKVLHTMSPMGTPIQTIDEKGSIRYGPHTYPPPPAEGRSTPANWIHMLVLDGASGAVVDVKGFDLDQAAAMKDAVVKTTGNQLVVLTGQGRNHGSTWTQANTEALTAAFKTLGATTTGPFFFGAAGLSHGSWSVVGAKGLLEGQADQNTNYTVPGVPEIAQGAPGKRGSLNGYIQEVLEGDFAYVSPETVPIDTNVAPNPQSNTIRVGTKTHASETLQPGQSGFHLLVLDGDNLEPLVPSQTFVTDLDDTTPNPSRIKDLATTLLGYADQPSSFEKPPLLILQSINRPHGFPDEYWVNDDQFSDKSNSENTRKQWSYKNPTIAGTIGALGGAAAHDQFANLGHDDTYVPRAQGDPVASTGYVPGAYTAVGSPALVSKDEDFFTQSQAAGGLPQSGVVGGLTRNNQSQWVLRNGAPNGGFDPNVMSQIAFQPATRWMTGATQPEQEADAWIAWKLFPDNAPPTVREYYQEIGQNWGNHAGELNEPRFNYPPNGIDPVSGLKLNFDSSTLSAVKAQLQTEMGYVENVRTAVLNFQKIFGTAQIDSIINEATIAGAITDSIYPPSKTTTSVDPWAILSNLFSLGSSFAQFAGPEGAALSAGLGVIGNGGALIESFIPKTTTTPGGVPLSQRISDRAGSIAAAVNQHYKTIGDGLTHLYGLMVSDWGKLQAANGKAGIWSNAPQQLIEQSFATAAKQEYALGLIPLVFDLYALNPQADAVVNSKPWLANTFECLDHDGDKFIHPFGNNSLATDGGRIFASRRSWFHPVPKTNNPANKLTWWWIQGQALSTTLDFVGAGQIKDTGRLPPSKLMSQLFSPVQRVNSQNNPAGNPGPLQMNKSLFFGDPAFKRRGITCDKTPER